MFPLLPLGDEEVAELKSSREGENWIRHTNSFVPFLNFSSSMFTVSVEYVCFIRYIRLCDLFSFAASLIDCKQSHYRTKTWLKSATVLRGPELLCKIHYAFQCMCRVVVVIVCDIGCGGGTGQSMLVSDAEKKNDLTIGEVVGRKAFL